MHSVGHSSTHRAFLVQVSTITWAMVLSPFGILTMLGYSQFNHAGLFSSDRRLPCSYRSKAESSLLVQDHSQYRVGSRITLMFIANRRPRHRSDRNILPSAQICCAAVAMLCNSNSEISSTANSRLPFRALIPSSIMVM